LFRYSDAPQSIGKVLDDMFRLYSASFSSVIWIGAVAAVIFSLPDLLVPIPAGDDPAAAFAAMRQHFLFLPLTMAASLLSQAIIVHRMHQFATGTDYGLGTAVRAALAKFLPLLAATILYLLAFMLGLIALLIPGVIFGLTLYFYLPLMLIDGEGVFSALGTSHRLVWGHWWRTAAVMAVPMFLIAVFFSIVVLMAGLAAGISAAAGAQAGGDAATSSVDLLTNVIIVMLSAFMVPLFPALLLVQVHDLKLRREGLDLEARLAG